MRDSLVIILLVLAWTLRPAIAAEPKRIEVYRISQQYYDVKAGDTLGEIVADLLPRNTRLQKKLMRDILAMNPQAFIDNDPDRLLAGERLWLPDGTPPPETANQAGSGRIETYQWGSIRRPD